MFESVLANHTLVKRIAIRTGEGGDVERRDQSSFGEEAER